MNQNKLPVGIVLGFGLIMFAAVAFAAYKHFNPSGSESRQIIQKAIPSSSQTTVDVFAENLDIPWSMAFTSDDRMLVTERTGAVRVIESGQLAEKPLHTFTEARAVGEAGLMGMAVDPSYQDNQFVYFCLAYLKGGTLTSKIVRGEDGGSEFVKVETLIDDIPAAQYHAGCRISFGPDGKLYVTTGDVTERGLAQDKQSLAGKILRYNADGSIPSDNPIAQSPVYSIGHRNPQGIDWHPTTGDLYSTEHGPSGFDGPGGGDEVNKIIAGGNYGWPEVSHDRTDNRFTSPLFVMTPAEAPASGMFYSGKMFPEWKHGYFFGALKGEGLIRMEVDDQGSINHVEKLFHEEFGRVRDVIEGPDGALYFSTSNRDGRGDVQDGDDKIVRISKQ